MAGRVEGHDLKAQTGERLDERAQLSGVARPAVQKVDGRAGAPDRARDPAAAASTVNGRPPGTAIARAGATGRGRVNQICSAQRAADSRCEPVEHRNATRIAGRMERNERSCFCAAGRCRGGHAGPSQSDGVARAAVISASKRAAGAGVGLLVAEQPQRVVAGEQYAVQILGELVGIGVAAELSLGDTGYRKTVAIMSNMSRWSCTSRSRTAPGRSSNSSRPRRRGSRQARRPSPASGRAARAAGARRAAPAAPAGRRSPRNGTGMLQDLQLKRLLGPEVSEQAALGQLGLLGERADRQSAEPDPARHLHGPVEHRGFGLVTLSHAPRKARPYGNGKLASTVNDGTRNSPF